MQTTMTGSGADANGSSASPSAARRDVNSRLLESHRAGLAESFASIVGILMRDPAFRRLRLADLDWLVVPPVAAGQFHIARARVARPDAKPEEGPAAATVSVPVGVALWARVSEAVDKRLSESLDKAPALQPGDWTSGDIVWLVVIAGDPAHRAQLVEQARKANPGAAVVKLRVAHADGKVDVRTIGPAST